MMTIPQESDDLRAMVTRLTGMADVTYVLHRYCDLVDANRREDILALFAPEATFDYGHGKIFTGRQELSALFAGLDQNEATSHHLSNITVTFDNPDTARSHSYIYAYHRRRADGRLVHLWGRYDDVLVRRPVPGPAGELWAIQRRALRGAAEHGIDPDPGWPSRYELIARTGRSA
jgi:hypothetical protein